MAVKIILKNSLCVLVTLFSLTLYADSKVDSSIKSDTDNSVDSYAGRTDVKVFAESFAAKHGKDAKKVLAILNQGNKKQSIIDAISRPAEKVLTWGEYRQIFIEPKRITNGVAFWNQHRALIEEISHKYQVAPEMIVAILGIETRYGKLTGGYRVLDALLTLSFDYEPRGKFFRGQLEEFLLMIDEQKLEPEKLTGSYAGAMGYGQFIPGSYRAYAVDYDKDGMADIWANPADAIASVANYFAKHQWQLGNQIAYQLTVSNIPAELLTSDLKPKTTVKNLRGAKIKVPDELNDDTKVTVMALETEKGTEYWLGFENFYVITRYNHSHMYALAAYQLSQILKLELDIKTKG